MCLWMNEPPFDNTIHETHSNADHCCTYVWINDNKGGKKIFEVKQSALPFWYCYGKSVVTMIFGG